MGALEGGVATTFGLAGESWPTRGIFWVLLTDLSLVLQSVCQAAVALS